MHASTVKSPLLERHGRIHTAPGWTRGRKSTVPDQRVKDFLEEVHRMLSGVPLQTPECGANTR